MHEIKCPNCGQVFQVDETGYAEIVRQIHDVEFEKELEQRVKELEKNSQNDMRIAKLEQEKKHSEALTRKDNELSEKDKIIEERMSAERKEERLMREKAEEIPIRQPADIYIPWADEDADDRDTDA